MFPSALHCSSHLAAFEMNIFVWLFHTTSVCTQHLYYSAKRSVSPSAPGMITWIPTRKCLWPGMPELRATKSTRAACSPWRKLPFRNCHVTPAKPSCRPTTSLLYRSLPSLFNMVSMIMEGEPNHFLRLTRPMASSTASSVLSQEPPTCGQRHPYRDMQKVRHSWRKHSNISFALREAAV